jgi:hemolysin III
MLGMAIHWTEENASQEAVNAWTHGLGFLLSLPAGLALCQLSLAHREQMLYACLAYSLSLTAMYLFSTLSHAVRDPVLRHRFRAFDQGVIYLLIAGTFTPFVCSYMTGWSERALLAAIWLAAAAGFYSKVIARHRIDNMTAVSYILLGWLPSMVLLSYVSLACFAVMAIGGCLYTVGTLFLQNDHRSWYFHAVWHLMVIVASACHYFAIALFSVLQLDRL